MNLKKMNHHIYFRTRSQGISEKSQKVPIYARIFYNDEWSTDFSTGIRTNKNKWNPQDQVIESDLSGQNQENIKLDLIRNDITRIINTWIMKGKEFVANDVRRAYIMKEVPKPTILETYREFLTEVKYKQKLKPSTLNKWKNSYLHFEGYIIEELQLPNMKFKQIQENTAKEYFNFLKEVKSISNDHSLRFASYLSQVVDYAKKKKYTKSNILSFEEMSRQKPRAKVYLEDDIFDSFASMKLHGILKQIQDIAIVICRSGVDYSDLTELQEGAKHSDYVSLYRGKNEEAAIVPILPIVRQVLKKHNYKLPQMHINTFNRHLHVFEGYLGLSFELKTKVLRKTAGTYFLNNGIRIEVVSKILGHTSIVTTQKYYADVLKKLVIKESLKLMNKPIKRRTKNLQQFI